MCSIKKLILMLAAVACLLLSAICVLAASSESIEVRIPVTNQGHPGTIGLYDKSGERLIQMLHLDAGGSGEFTMIIDTLGTKIFKIRTVNEDTDEIEYDNTVFEAEVFVGYNETDELISAVVVRREGEVTKEEDGLMFAHMDGRGYHNYETKPDESEPNESKPDTEKPTEEYPPETVGPDKEPEKLPQTGTLRWLVPYLLVTGIILIAAGVIIIRAGRYEE